MNEWSRTRKRIILGLVLLALIILIGVPMFFALYKKPTCSDGKQNGDETGVDCGGSCQLVCSAESLPLILKGDPRVLTVAPNAYEVVAVIENPNAKADIYKAAYTLKVYDASSTIPVKLYQGETYIPKGSTFAIFEGPFILEQGVVPTRAVLEWQKDTLVWKKDVATSTEIMVSNISLSNATGTPRLEATLENPSLDSVSNIDLTAIISDENGNIFAASKTYVDKLSPGGNEPVVFTWPRPFPQQAASVNIITRIFPDSTFLR